MYSVCVYLIYLIHSNAHACKFQPLLPLKLSQYSTKCEHVEMVLVCIWFCNKYCMKKQANYVAIKLSFKHVLFDDPHLVVLFLFQLHVICESMILMFFVS